LGVRVPLDRRDRDGVLSGDCDGDGVGSAVEAMVDGEASVVSDPGVESLRIRGFVPALSSDVTSISFLPGALKVDGCLRAQTLIPRVLWTQTDTRNSSSQSLRCFAFRASCLLSSLSCRLVRQTVTLMFFDAAFE
jgi:hypothetical protein